MFNLEQGDRNMELIGLKVKHTVFGAGVITEMEGNYITVEFAAKTTKLSMVGIAKPFCHL